MKQIGFFLVFTGVVICGFAGFLMPHAFDHGKQAIALCAIVVGAAGLVTIGAMLIDEGNAR